MSNSSCLFNLYNRFLYQPQPEGSRTARKNSSPLIAQPIFSAWIACTMSRFEAGTYFPTIAVALFIHSRINISSCRSARSSTARIMRMLRATQRNREEYDTIFTARLAFKYGWGGYFIGLAVHARHTCESPSRDERILFIPKTSTSFFILYPRDSLILTSTVIKVLCPRC